KPLVCQRGSPGRLSSHCAAYGGPVFRRCALRVLAPPALRASNGQRPGRECIFTANASVCFAKNARNDVHAVISDESLVLPLLCQGSVFAAKAAKNAFSSYFPYFLQLWLATVQLVLQADWQEAWHSPQPP